MGILVSEVAFDDLMTFSNFIELKGCGSKQSKANIQYLNLGRMTKEKEPVKLIGTLNQSSQGFLT